MIPPSPFIESLRDAVVQTLRPFDPRLIYLFGSAARDALRPDSDIDLAYLAHQSPPTVERYQLAQGLALKLGRDVDLIDLREASDVMKFQILKSAVPLYASSEKEKNNFEMYAFSDYARFAEERKPILDAIRREGTIYGP